MTVGFNKVGSLLVATLGVLGIAVLAQSPVRAQASSYTAVEAKLQVSVAPGINVTADYGQSPILSYGVGGGATLPLQYGNNVSGGGITTGVIVDARTTSGPDPSYAFVSYGFTPAVFLNNTTDSYQPYSFIYNISFGHNVSATPNGGSAFATTTTNIVFGGSNTGDLNTFFHTLTRSDGYAENNDPIQLGGSNGIAPHSSIYLYVRTSVSTEVRYTPPMAVVPEPASLVLILPVAGLVAIYRRGRAMARKEKGSDTTNTLA